MTLDEVFDAIAQFPEGLTSKQISDFLGRSANQVSGLTSKLFQYGKIDRELAPGHRRIYRYKPKKDVEADPKTMTAVKARYRQGSDTTKKRTRQSTRRQAKKLETARTQAALDLIDQPEGLNAISEEQNTQHSM